MGYRRQILAGDVEGASVAAALARRYLLPFASQHMAGILLQLLWRHGRLVVLLKLLARRTTLRPMHPLQFGNGATAVGRSRWQSEAVADVSNFLVALLGG